MTKYKSVICSCHITVTRLLVVSQSKLCFSIAVIVYIFAGVASVLGEDLFYHVCSFILFEYFVRLHIDHLSFYVVPFDFSNLLTCALFALDTSALFELKKNILCVAVILLSRDTVLIVQ